ncbi:MAG: hypothetical protein FWF83_02030 [Clostridiales bacterium]|nr:hypothetical protein [Clostridiales bacterium]
MTADRENRDERYIAVLEDMTQALRRITHENPVEDKEPELQSQVLRFRHLEELAASERRLIEEVSPPCRLILEHLSTFIDQPDRSVSIKYGQIMYSHGDFLGFTINEWGHVTLKIGNCRLTWRDDEYRYMFYADKIVLRANDIQKPEISLSFTFSLKYSKLLEGFPDVPGHPQTAYYQPDLFHA